MIHEEKLDVSHIWLYAVSLEIEKEQFNSLFKRRLDLSLGNN
tara:strand:+ start:346 stop:471 length:126 start_codon:yes stop_codon:yes gene_type:complete